MTARFLIIATAFAAGSLAQSDRRFLIAPGQYFGLIREGSSRGDLAQAYGPKAVSDHDVQIGEGLCTPGTRILASFAVFLTYDSVSAPRLSEQELASIPGDKLIRSDLSVVRRLPIVISTFIQSWGAPIQVHACQ